VQLAQAGPQERIHLQSPGGQVGLRGGVLGWLGPETARLEPVLAGHIRILT